MREKAVIELSKLGVSQEEVHKLYDETYEKFKGKISPENEEMYKAFVYNNVVGKFFKRKKIMAQGNYKEYETVFFGKSRITDYGAQKKYDDCLRRFNEADETEKEAMVKKGEVFVSDKGQVLVLDQNQWRKGEPLVPEQQKTCSLYGITDLEGRKVFTVVQVPHLFVGQNISVYKPTKYFASEATKSSEDQLVLNLSKFVEPPFLVEDKEVAMKTILQNAFKVISISKYEEYCLQNSDKKIVCVSDMIFRGSHPRQILISDDATLQSAVTMWSNETIEFIDGAPALLLIEPYKTKEGEWKGNILSAFIDDAYKIPEIQSAVNNDPELEDRNEDSW